MRTTKRPRPVLGTFGKGIDGSVSLNFDVSGGANCSRECALHPDSNNPNRVDSSTACYAVRTEIRPDRLELKRKLERHNAMEAYKVCGAAIVELTKLIARDKTPPWLRISTNGSVPMPADVTTLFRTQFRALLSLCKDHGIPVHFPCESSDNVRFYRALCDDLVVVRESLTVDHAQFVSDDGAVSATAGTRKQTRVERVESARQLAKARRESTGRKTIVCPAITNSWSANKTRKHPIPSNPRAKCGACVACAKPDCDVVYPLH